jgi:hypothetical protein
MDANKIFSNLLSMVETSHLNYSMNRTPFSATISLKSSFVKYFEEEHQIKRHENLEFLPSEEVHFVKMKELEAENCELKDKLKKLQVSSDIDREKLEKESFTFQKVYDGEKEKVKAAETKISEFREEVLKIKNENHKMSSQLKAQKEDFEVTKKGNKALKKENESLQKKLKEKVEALDVQNLQLKSAKKASESLQGVLDEIKIELDNSKLKEKTENQNVFKCDECDTRVQSYSQLKIHIKCYHYHNKSSQFEELIQFDEYPCFYCNKTIISDQDLEAHITVCDELSTEQRSNMYQEEDPCQCDYCDAKCTDMDFERHRTAFHGLGTLSEDLEIFRCDICPLYFESNVDLQFHRRGCHWDHM